MSPSFMPSMLETDETVYAEEDQVQTYNPPTMTFKWNRILPKAPSFIEEEELEEEEYKNQQKSPVLVETEEGPGNSKELHNPLRGYEPT